MRPAPDLSVVIPLFNKETTIERALRSVLDQPFAGQLEVIVVDDGSTDGSCDRAAGFRDARIQLHRQQNAGPGAARNAGAAFARAPFLTFLDADDEWSRDFGSHGLAALQSCPDCVAYVSGYDAMDHAHLRGNKLRALGLDGPAGPDYQPEPKRWKPFVDAMHSSCVMVRRETFEAFGGFFDAPRVQYGEDSFLWAQVLVSAPIYWDPEPRCLFHLEDSALGFAVTRRRTARPLTLLGPDLVEAQQGAAADAMARLVAEFARDDLSALGKACALGAATKVRRQHGLNVSLGVVEDIVKAAEDRLRRIFAGTSAR